MPATAAGIAAVPSIEAAVAIAAEPSDAVVVAVIEAAAAMEAAANGAGIDAALLKTGACTDDGSYLERAKD